jgi:hypothetical protein
MQRGGIQNIKAAAIFSSFGGALHGPWSNTFGTLLYNKMIRNTWFPWNISVMEIRTSIILGLPGLPRGNVWVWLRLVTVHRVPGFRFYGISGRWKKKFFFFFLNRVRETESLDSIQE